MNHKVIATFVASSLMMSGCASLGKTLKSNVFIGGSIGATAGAIGGAAVGSPKHPVNGALIGTAIGAVVGSVVGLLTEPKTDKKVEITGMGKGIGDPEAPVLTSPQVRKVWVEPKIEGDHYYTGHFMYVIERGSVWTMQ